RSSQSRLGHVLLLAYAARSNQWRPRRRCSRGSTRAPPLLSPASSSRLRPSPQPPPQRGGCASAAGLPQLKPSSASSTPRTLPRRPRRLHRRHRRPTARRGRRCWRMTVACRRIWRARYGSRGRPAPISSTPAACEESAELLIPQLEFLNQEGAQAEVWALSRILLDTLAEETGQVVKAVFPDAGVAALLKHQWKDAKFKCASLSDRKPVDTDDGVVVMIIPDHQMLESVERIASQLADDPIRPLVMWNPRLVSGDVGVGYNVRNLRRNFLSTFTTVYSMRPLPTGAIFRCYPEKWKVFYDDPKRPNRYLLARESSSRPDATDIEIIFGGGGASEQPEEEPSMMTNVMAAFSSVSRFMRVISK
uniref:DUF1995 domain-containing protein n=2 Tax=Aegilops tauschii subsp. strangulata TaxID=200361 RepID=A0A453QNM9_AEGTS